MADGGTQFTSDYFVQKVEKALAEYNSFCDSICGSAQSPSIGSTVVSVAHQRIELDTETGTCDIMLSDFGMCPDYVTLCDILSRHLNPLECTIYDDVITSPQYMKVKIVRIKFPVKDVGVDDTQGAGIESMIPSLAKTGSGGCCRMRCVIRCIMVAAFLFLILVILVGLISVMTKTEDTIPCDMQDQTNQALVNDTRIEQ